MLGFVRTPRDGAHVVVLLNFTPVPRRAIASACRRAGRIARS